MRINRLIATLGMVFSLSSYSEAQAEQYFDIETGKIGPVLKEYLEAVSIPLESHTSEGELDIFKVNHLLQEKCFQRDHNFFKNGGKGNLELSEDQAISVLNLIYSHKEDLRPNYQPGQIKEPITLILQLGDEVTTADRLPTVMELLKEGFEYYNILISIGEHNIGDFYRILEKTEFKETKETLEKLSKVYACPPTQNMFETNLTSMKEEGNLQTRYVLVTGQPIAESAKKIAESALGKDYSCLGVACQVDKDWRQRMHKYGYIDTIAWALAELNFIARQVNTEARQFLKAHGLDETIYLGK